MIYCQSRGNESRVEFPAWHLERAAVCIAVGAVLIDIASGHKQTPRPARAASLSLHRHSAYEDGGWMCYNVVKQTPKQEEREKESEKESEKERATRPRWNGKESMKKGAM